MKIKNILMIIPLIILSACISAEQTTDEMAKKDPEVYVFDDVKKVEEQKTDTLKNEPTQNVAKVEHVNVDSTLSTPADKVKRYTIQLGAFTSKERADAFVNENQNKTSLQMQVSFNAITRLFVVKVPSYKTKDEADLIRDNLRKFPAFKDSFTVLVEN